MRRGAVFAVFLCCLLLLGWKSGNPAIATGYIDPVAGIQAQDEAIFASISFQMADHGDWLNPQFLRRYAFWKPPLLYWLSAAGVKLLGHTTLALRWSSLVAGAAACALVFAWAWSETGSWAIGLSAALLLGSSRLFFDMSRIGLTDGLLAFEIALAMYALGRDPKLESRFGLLVFGGATGAAMMTKGVAGALPLLALAVYCVIGRERPRLKRIAQAAAVAAIVAAPWHLYQLFVHLRWFWGEYVLMQTVVYGAGSPPQISGESQLGFYFRRLWLLDPPLLVAVSIALAWFAWTRARGLRPAERVVLVWTGMILAAVLSFRYRNASHLAPVFPALAMLAALAVPRRAGFLALTGALILFAVKARAPERPWGLPFGPESVNPSYAPLERYAALRRGNDLILIEPDDQFYSACLPLASVHYMYQDPRSTRPRIPPDFEYLGVLVTAPDFNRLSELRPIFEGRLHKFGLNSGAPIATTIVARNEDEIAEAIQRHPEADFFAPAAWAARDGGLHWQWPAGNGDSNRVFLLSREVIQRP